MRKRRARLQAMIPHCPGCACIDAGIENRQRHVLQQVNVHMIEAICSGIRAAHARAPDHVAVSRRGLEWECQIPFGHALCCEHFTSHPSRAGMDADTFHRQRRPSRAHVATVNLALPPLARRMARQGRLVQSGITPAYVSHRARPRRGCGPLRNSCSTSARVHDDRGFERRFSRFAEPRDAADVAQHDEVRHSCRRQLGMIRRVALKHADEFCDRPRMTGAFRPRPL